LKNTQRSDGRYTAPVSIEADSGRAVEAPQDEYVFSVGSVGNPLRIIWRRLWLIVLVGVAVAGATVWYDYQQTPTYSASIKLLIGQDTSVVSNISSLQGEAQGLEAITKTMASAIATRPVAEATVEQLD
jgi:uncharacterized protein involved in exopolysaccharide biosynthesis